ncbi:hypothetical protein SeMB42_g07019 [Synchytrium endobioticum]|uniref:Uncharacterized protein n=1 Tax=Synchytrium endobioticum TaxID=286115 RepID=A0A507CBX1_9FUNG|nr:hypothetical protein SeMB42_g07019 [Synchytrium endobioticum]
MPRASGCAGIKGHLVAHCIQPSFRLLHGRNHSNSSKQSTTQDEAIFKKKYNLFVHKIPIGKKSTQKAINQKKAKILTYRSSFMYHYLDSTINIHGYQILLEVLDVTQCRQGKVGSGSREITYTVYKVGTKCYPPGIQVLHHVQRPSQTRSFQIFHA